MSILRLVFIYFLFNMLIVPGFAATAYQNIFDIIYMGLQTTSSLFHQIFSIYSGDFFLILILQSAGGAFFVNQTSIIDVILFYCSPHLFFKSRLFKPSLDYLRKTEDIIFPYGLFYAQELVVIGIGIVFQYSLDSCSATIPFLSLAVIFYLLLRHFSDAHQLIIWHKHELDSAGKLVRVVYSRSILQSGGWSFCLSSLSSPSS